MNPPSETRYDFGGVDTLSSSAKQIEDNVGALNNRHFSQRTLEQIEAILTGV